MSLPCWSAGEHALLMQHDRPAIHSLEAQIHAMLKLPQPVLDKLLPTQLV
jgi:hypothetical protein